MSDVVFPNLPGLQYPIARVPEWETNVQRTASGRTFATTWWTYPIWHWTLKYEFLRRNASFSELEQLVGFFNARAGRYDSFLFVDPDDNYCSAFTFGLGDGVTRDFTLARAIGSFIEPIGGINGTPTIAINGSPTTAFSILGGYLCRFDSAPPSGAVLQWTGYYYNRTEFEDDRMDLEKFMSGLWSASGVKIRTRKA